jgi:hypothetical protein
VAATVPSFLSISGSPITTSGTLAISYSGTALPVANGGTGTTTSTGSGSVVLGTSPTITTPTIDKINTSVSNVSLGAGNASLMKNRIINGAMVIDQRNAGASVTPTTFSYTLDRWACILTQASKFTVQQNAGSVTPPVGFSKYLGITSSSAYSVGSTDRFGIYQVIEGFNAADLGWGTANAKTVTLSFQVYSSLTGTFSGTIRSGSGTDTSYPFTYSIPVANTWTTISITIVGPTTGTWVSDNSAFAYVFFSLGLGSSFSGTAGSWATANYWGTSSSVSVVGTSGATFYTTGIQLEVGSSATGFEYVNYQTSLANCQRYYEVCSTVYLQAGLGLGGSNILTGFYRTTKRATPTLTLTQVVGSGGGQFSNTVDNWSASAAVDGNGRIGYSATSSAEL